MYVWLMSVSIWLWPNIFGDHAVYGKR